MSITEFNEKGFIKGIPPVDAAEMSTYTINIFKKGETNGLRKEIFLSVQEGDYSAARGAEKLGISEEEFIKQMREKGYTIPSKK